MYVVVFEYEGNADIPDVHLEHKHDLAINYAKALIYDYVVDYEGINHETGTFTDRADGLIYMACYEDGPRVLVYEKDSP